MEVRFVLLCCWHVVGFSVDHYETQLDIALRPVIDAAKLVVSRTSQVVGAVVVFVVAVHVVSAVLRYYFRLTDAVAGPRTVYVTGHVPPVVVGGGASSSGLTTDDDGCQTLMTRSRRPVPGEAVRVGEQEYDSAAEDDHDASMAGPRRPPVTGTLSTPSSSGQLTLRTARRTSATTSPQSSLDFKYSETKV